jgi:hypothetical protein
MRAVERMERARDLFGGDARLGRKRQEKRFVGGQIPEN